MIELNWNESCPACSNNCPYMSLQRSMVFADPGPNMSQICCVNGDLCRRIWDFAEMHPELISKRGVQQMKFYKE